MKKFWIPSADKRKKKPAMSRCKLQMEWYANGFDPDRKRRNQDFVKATKQTALTFDVERIGNQRYSAMNGIDAIVTSPPTGEKGYSSGPEKAKSILIEDWRPILRGESTAFHIVGAKVQSGELNVWIFHPESQTLFMLNFSQPLDGDDWLEKPVYSFAN